MSPLNESGNLIIETPRLRLREFHVGDADVLRTLLSDKEISAGAINMPYPPNKEKIIKWIHESAEMMKSGEAIRAAVLSKASLVIIGYCGLQVNHRHKHAELGFWIGKEYWGNGYASEAASAVISYGFNSLKLNKIFAHHLSRNIASGKVLQKSGMKFEGTFKRHIKVDQNFEDIDNYAVLFEEHKNGT